MLEFESVCRFAAALMLAVHVGTMGSVAPPAVRIPTAARISEALLSLSFLAASVSIVKGAEPLYKFSNTAIAVLTAITSALLIYHVFTTAMTTAERVSMFWKVLPFAAVIAVLGVVLMGTSYEIGKSEAEVLPKIKAAGVSSEPDRNEIRDRNTLDSLRNVQP